MNNWLARRIVAGTAAVTVLALLIAVAHNQFTLAGLQAEAKVMLTYIHTLETAYFTEHGRYVAFDSYYGAPIKGQDRCTQPPGAGSLGFVIRWCHKEGSAPVRYAYNARAQDDPKNPNYRATALSGSDELDQSFVCFGDFEKDEWWVDKKGVVTRSRECE